MRRSLILDRAEPWHYDLCRCGTPKAKTSRRCFACSWQVRRRDSKRRCPRCGGSKRAASLRCFACGSREGVMPFTTPWMYDRCACGGRKGRDARSCRACWAASLPRHFPAVKASP